MKAAASSAKAARLRTCGRRLVIPSELRLELNAPDLRFVDETGQVVEVDAADGDLFVRDVPTEHRDFIRTFAPVVTRAQAALEQRLAGELGGLVEEEVHFAAIGPVGVDEELTHADGDAVTQREVRNHLG